MKKKILIIEDEPTYLVGLSDMLMEEGYEVVTASDGEMGLKRQEKEQPNLILLDIRLKEMDGYDVCRQIRQNKSKVPIIMLTNKRRDTDKVLGLEIGADDYVVKDTSPQELLARIKAVLRRGDEDLISMDNKVPISFGNVLIDPKALIGRKGGNEIKVTSREVKLLKLFMEHDGEVVSRDTILEKVWGLQYTGTTRRLDQAITTLRQKIEDNPLEPKHILTVHGEGYRFISAP